MFKKYVLAKKGCDVGPGGTYSKENINIKKVRLSLDRVMKKNEGTKGYLVLVWIYSGDVTSVYQDQTFQDTDIDIVEINAIDGSFINDWGDTRMRHNN